MEDAIAVAIARIETKLDAALQSAHDHETRLRTIEGKSGKRWENLIGQMIAVAVAAGCGVLLGTNL